MENKLTHPELLAPAGSPEAVRAAVCAGADAVYMGYGSFNARRGAKNFTKQQIEEAIAYCRTYGVRTNITLNTLVSDREMPQLLEDAESVLRCGADALIVQDLGAARLIHEYFPQAELHASTQMTIHSLEGALFAKKMGFSRAVLSRELCRRDIENITRNAGIETEVFVHGALCMCYSGQCELSAVIGRRSGNRGLCAQPCRLPYNGKNNYPMSLKDNCLISELGELAKAGVASLKIEGRMKRPEYVAVVTGIYSSVLRENRMPTERELDNLKKIFSRDGFTQGYYKGKTGTDMFGVRTQVSKSELNALYEQAEKIYRNDKSISNVPVDFEFCAQAGKPVSLRAYSEDNLAESQGTEPQRAEKRPITEEDIKKSLGKTGGTVFYADSIKISLDDGLSIPAREINALRRSVLENLTAQRESLPQIKKAVPAEHVKAPSDGKFKGYTVQSLYIKSITKDMCSLPIKTIYLPAHEIAKNTQRAQQIISSDIELVPTLPRIIWDGEWKSVQKNLEECKKLGCKSALVGNIGQIEPVKRLGMRVYGDFGLNVFNAAALETLRAFGAERQTLSFELRFAQLRDISKPVETEIIVAGRLPLMITENCMIAGKNGGCRRDGKGPCSKGAYYLKDRTGSEFPIFREAGCRNTLYNSQPLCVEKKEYDKLGIAYGRIILTDETPEQAFDCVSRLCMGEMPYDAAQSTRGLYRRGVE